MSIPQICPNCESHIGGPHAKDCCYGTPEYAHLGWPNTTVNVTPTGAVARGDGYALMSVAHPCHSHTVSMEEIAAWDRRLAGDLTALQRMLEFLTDEPAEEPKDDVLSAVLDRIRTKSETLRNEAAGIHLVEARAKRIFAADVLDSIISELSE